MPPFDQLYLELYSAINEALVCIGQGETEEAVEKLITAQMSTIETIIACL